MEMAVAMLDFNSMDNTVQKKGGWLPEALSEDPEQPFPEISWKPLLAFYRFQIEPIANLELNIGKGSTFGKSF